MTKRNVVWPLAIVAVLGSSSVLAVDFHTLHIDDWVGFWPGLNQVYDFNTGDDVTFDPDLATHEKNLIPGPLNPTGSTASYYFSDPTFFNAPPAVDFTAEALWMGYSSGTTTVAGPLVFGVNTITGLTGSLDQNIFDPRGNLADIDEMGNSSAPILLNDNVSNPDIELIPGFANTTTIVPGNGFVNDYHYRPTEIGPGSVEAWRTVNAGAYLLPDQDAATVFAGDADLIALMNYFKAELDDNVATEDWTFLGVELTSFFAVDPITGLALSGPTGLGSQAFYSLDAGAAPVPLPATLPFLISGLSGLFAFIRRRGVR